MKSTETAYREIIAKCKDLFERKNRDYGTSWRILRLPSITDQVYIKAQRIRTIQEKGVQRVEDDIAGEFVGIINYCVMALILSGTGPAGKELSADDLLRLYTDQTDQVEALLFNKNHDYGEAWRDMRISSMTDIILMKLLRIKQIEENKGQTIVSEGVRSGYQDIINYSVFCLIRIGEKETGR